MPETLCRYCGRAVTACPDADRPLLGGEQAVGCRGWVHDADSWHLCDPGDVAGRPYPVAEPEPIPVAARRVADELFRQAFGHGP